MPRNQNDEVLFIENPNDIVLDSSHIATNGTNTVTISNVAPSAVGTATISRWLQINDKDTGTAYFLPMWT